MIVISISLFNSFSCQYQAFIIDSINQGIIKDFAIPLEETKKFVIILELTYYAGEIVGTVLLVFSVLRFGIKNNLLIFSVLGVTACSFQISSIYIERSEMLYFGEILYGLANGIMGPLSAIYIAEISRSEVRGRAIVVNQLGIIVGVLSSISLRFAEFTKEFLMVAFAIPGCFLLVSLVFIAFFPESPRFLHIIRDNQEESKLSLLKLRGRFEIQSELDELDMEKKKCRPPHSIFSIFRDKTVRFPLVTTIICYIGIQMSGINMILIHFHNFTESIDFSAKWYNFSVTGFGVGLFLSCIIGFFLIDRIGRRKLLVWPILVISMIYLLFSVAINTKTIWLMFVVISTLFYVYGLSFGCVGQLMAIEYFKQDSRLAAVSVANFIQNCFNIISFLIFFLPATVTNYMFLLNCGFCFFVFAYLYVFMHETVGMSFQQIAKMLEKFRSVGLRLIYLVNKIFGI